MPDIEAPTGDEKPQKYYGSSYLEEVDKVKVEVQRAAATGTEPDLSEFDPRDVSVVAPHYLTEEQREEVVNSTSQGSNPEGVLHPTDGLTMVEANNDVEGRVKLGQSTLEGYEDDRGDPESQVATGPVSNIEGKKPVGITADSFDPSTAKGDGNAEPVTDDDPNESETDKGLTGTDTNDTEDPNGVGNNPDVPQFEGDEPIGKLAPRND